MSASYDLMNKFGAITHGSSCAQSHSGSMAIGRQTRGLPLQVLRSFSSLQFLDSLSRGFETT